VYVWVVVVVVLVVVVVSGAARDRGAAVQVLRARTC
jgi:hypothetical protein